MSTVCPCSGSVYSKPVCLLELMLEATSVSLGSPPQIVLQYTVTFYCLCAGRCVQSYL